MFLLSAKKLGDGATLAFFRTLDKIKEVQDSFTRNSCLVLDEINPGDVLQLVYSSTTIWTSLLDPTLKCDFRSRNGDCTIPAGVQRCIVAANAVDSMLDFAQKVSRDKRSHAAIMNRIVHVHFTERLFKNAQAPVQEDATSSNMCTAERAAKALEDALSLA